MTSCYILVPAAHTRAPFLRCAAWTWPTWALLPSSIRCALPVRQESTSSFPWRSPTRCNRRPQVLAHLKVNPSTHAERRRSDGRDLATMHPVGGPDGAGSAW